MQKLTVREAAENLGISEDAVRKRIQRGTLAHRKASDGRVYVYMDTIDPPTPNTVPTQAMAPAPTPNAASNHAGAQQETSAAEISPTNQYNRSSWWEYAAGASALIVVTSGLIYVLGLFTLWAPIAMTNADYLTAWHAASLVPKTVVAGLGVTQLIAFPLLTGSAIFVVVFSFYKWRGRIYTETIEFLSLYVPVIIYCTWHISTGPSPLSQVPEIPLVAFVVVVSLIMYSLVSTIYWLYADGVNRREVIGRAILILMAVVPAYLFWTFLAADQASLRKPSVAIYSLITVAIVVGAGIIVYWAAVMEASIRLETQPLHSGPVEWLQPFLIVVFAAFVAAFMLAIPSKLPLPSVEIDVKGKDKEAVNGKLLAHTDAFWHVLQQEKSRVTAIPDDEVERAWVSKDQ